MNYEIITSRWVCPECGSPLRLFFAQVAEIEADAPGEEYICERAICNMTHELPDELAQEAMDSADQEFSAAFERGFKVAEVWCVPIQEDQSPNESLPPEG